MPIPTPPPYLLLYGTRPEFIKLAPLAHALKRAGVAHELVSTGQHRELLAGLETFFGLSPAHRWEVMRPGQSLGALMAGALSAAEAHFARHAPGTVVVQGDTTTAAAGALAAFLARIPVAHVEAGLRTNNLDAPFPEELNRRVIGQAARLHLAPTRMAAAALRAERIEATGARIVVTGNTVIDALHWACRQVKSTPPESPVLHAIRSWKSVHGRRVILMTGHRRESFGAPFEALCDGIARIAQAAPEAMIVYPVHRNPNVVEVVHRRLGSVAGVCLCEPMPYPDFVAALMEAHLVITDSGGVQEEAPALGVPVLVTRETTERPESIAAGGARLVGTSPERLVRETLALLRDDAAHRAMAQSRSPYGDGLASDRCVAALCNHAVSEFDPDQESAV